MADQPPSHMPHYDYRDDEISLYELWNTLVKRRVLIGVVLALSVAGASVFALTRTPVYTMDAVLEVGVMPTLNGGGLQKIAAPSEVISQALEVVAPRIQAKRPVQPGTESWTDFEAEILNAEAGLIRFHTQIPAEQASRSTEHANLVLDAVIGAHGSDLEQRANHLNRRLSEAREELDRVLRANEGLVSAIDAAQGAAQMERDNIEALNRQLSATLSSIVGAVISQNAAAEVSAIRDSIARLDAAADNMRPTQVVRAPALADSPEGQPAATIIALGAVLGLMLGVFAAFGREFLANAAAEGTEN